MTERALTPGETLVVVALHEEARPLCRLLDLRADDSARGFRCFRRDDVHLVVSGPGRERAGLATAYGAARLQRCEHAVFLNVGVAGSGLDAESHPVGSSLLAHSIAERASGRRFFPSLCFDSAMPTAAVVTCDEVETAYAERALFEMEASGFYSAARRFATAELVQCLKVVSDHPLEPVARLDGAAITRCVEQSLPRVEELLLDLAEMSAEIDPPRIRDLTARWTAHHRLTRTQERRVASAARRLVALGAREPDAAFFARVANAKALVAELDAYIDERSVEPAGGAP